MSIQYLLAQVLSLWPIVELRCPVQSETYTAFGPITAKHDAITALYLNKSSTNDRMFVI